MNFKELTKGYEPDFINFTSYIILVGFLGLGISFAKVGAVKDMILIDKWLWAVSIVVLLVLMLHLLKHAPSFTFPAYAVATPWAFSVKYPSLLPVAVITYILYQLFWVYTTPWRSIKKPEASS